MCTVVHMMYICCAHQLAPPLSALSDSSQQAQSAGSNSKATVGEAELLANSNPDSSPNVQSMIDAVTALASEHRGVKSALKEYLVSDRTLKDLAHAHSCCPATLTYWIHKLGLPQRTRGRRKLLTPTKKHLRVINLVRVHGIAGAARREGISKQRASKIVRLWAPELKGRHKRFGPLPPPKRREPRKIVVSFRLSENEWRLLQAAPLMPGWSKMSVFAKARAIILKHLKVQGDDETGSDYVTAGTALDDPNAEVSDVYRHKARNVRQYNRLV